MDGKRAVRRDLGAPEGDALAVPRLSAVEFARHRILHYLKSGRLGPGQRMPGERHLAEEVGVSRSTLREALDVIERTGLIRRVPGRGGGTFVVGAKVARDLTEIASVPAYLVRQGFLAGTKVVGTATLPSDAETSAALQIPEGALVFEIVRVRLADGAPLSLEHARLPAELFPSLLDLPLGGSVYELLSQRYGVKLARSEEQIEVLTAGAAEARLLDVALGAPLLAFERISYSDEGTPIEYSHDLFRSDRTRIVFSATDHQSRMTPDRNGTRRIEVRAGMP